MGGSSGGSTTTVQKADPWGPSQGYLKAGMGDARQLYEAGGFAPGFFPGQSYAGLGGTSKQALRDMARDANGTPLVSNATRGVQDMLRGADSFVDLDASEYGPNSEKLAAVKQTVLDDVIPASIAPFAASGMTDSSTAMDTVARSAASALAPIEYGAYNQAADRRIGLAQLGGDWITRGSTLAPQLEQAQFIDEDRLFQVGQMYDANRQGRMDDARARWDVNATQDARNLQAYQQLLMGSGGMGGTTSATAPGASTGSRMVGGGLSGAAMGSMVGGPYGAAIGGGLGILGAFL